MPIGAAADKRDAILPDVPTLAEQGYPNTDASNWYALLAPAKTPPAVIAKLNKAVNAALDDPDGAREAGQIRRHAGRRHAGSARRVHEGANTRNGARVVQRARHQGYAVARIRTAQDPSCSLARPGMRYSAGTRRSDRASTSAARCGRPARPALARACVELGVDALHFLDAPAHQATAAHHSERHGKHRRHRSISVCVRMIYPKTGIHSSLLQSVTRPNARASSAEIKSSARPAGMPAADRCRSTPATRRPNQPRSAVIRGVTTLSPKRSRSTVRKSPMRSTRPSSRRPPSGPILAGEQVVFWAGELAAAARFHQRDESCRGFPAAASSAARRRPGSPAGTDRASLCARPTYRAGARCRSWRSACRSRTCRRPRRSSRRSNADRR